ncbi:MAG: NADH-quinone oxidoreductase subunit NuoE [Bacteroidota bacterium]
MLSPENLQRIEILRKSYPHAQAMVLPVLWIAQEQYGYISQETMKEVATLLNLPFGHILGVVTFYTMYHTKPVGKNHIEVCTNVSCMIRGSEKIIRHLEGKLGITVGETSNDGAWTLSEVECMGACAGAPMCAVGEEYYENMTPESVDRMIEGFSKGQVGA